LEAAQEEVGNSRLARSVESRWIKLVGLGKGVAGPRGVGDFQNIRNGYVLHQGIASPIIPVHMYRQMRPEHLTQDRFRSRGPHSILRARQPVILDDDLAEL